MPKLYHIGPNNEILNATNVIQWQIEAIVETGLIFTVALLIFSQPGLNSDGINSDIYIFGLTVYLSIYI